MVSARTIALAKTVWAVEKVRERLHRPARALESASVPYAVVDGNAVAAWVTTVDEAAVLNTRDVDVLVRLSLSPVFLPGIEAPLSAYFAVSLRHYAFRMTLL